MPGKNCGSPSGNQLLYERIHREVSESQNFYAEVIRSLPWGYVTTVARGFQGQGLQTLDNNIMMSITEVIYGS